MASELDAFGPIPHSGDFVVTHMFDASRDLVWAAYTLPEHLKHWWGPAGFKTLATEVDLRPGGRFRYGMEAPNGDAMWGLRAYRLIEPPRHMVAAVSFTNAAGQTVRHPMEPNWPLVMLCSMTLEEQGGRTMLSLISRPENATDTERTTFEAGRADMKQGFNGSFAMLDAYLAKLPT